MQTILHKSFYVDFMYMCNIEIARLLYIQHRGHIGAIVEDGIDSVVVSFFLSFKLLVVLSFKPKATRRRLTKV